MISGSAICSLDLLAQSQDVQSSLAPSVGFLQFDFSCSFRMKKSHQASHCSWFRPKLAGHLQLPPRWHLKRTALAPFKTSWAMDWRLLIYSCETKSSQMVIMNQYILAFALGLGQSRPALIITLCSPGRSGIMREPSPPFSSSVPALELASIPSLWAPWQALHSLVNPSTAWRVQHHPMTAWLDLAYPSRQHPRCSTSSSWRCSKYSLLQHLQTAFHLEHIA